MTGRGRDINQSVGARSRFHQTDYKTQQTAVHPLTFEDIVIDGSNGTTETLTHTTQYDIVNTARAGLLFFPSGAAHTGGEELTVKAYYHDSEVATATITTPAVSDGEVGVIPVDGVFPGFFHTIDKISFAGDVTIGASETMTIRLTKTHTGIDNGIDTVQRAVDSSKIRASIGALQPMYFEEVVADAATSDVSLTDSTKYKCENVASLELWIASNVADYAGGDTLTVKFYKDGFEHSDSGGTINTPAVGNGKIDKMILSSLLPDDIAVIDHVALSGTLTNANAEVTAKLVKKTFLT